MVTLTGKNVVIVGASRGVGRAIAHRTGAEGAHVLAVGRNPAPLEQLAQQLPGIKTLAIDAAAAAAPRASLRPCDPTYWYCAQAPYRQVGRSMS